MIVVLFREFLSDKLNTSASESQSATEVAAKYHMFCSPCGVVQEDGLLEKVLIDQTEAARLPRVMLRPIRGSRPSMDGAIPRMGQNNYRQQVSPTLPTGVACRRGFIN